MYEVKPKKSFNFNNANINWKSLLIKLGLLLAALFIVILVISLVKKDKKVVESNLSTNLNAMQVAAKEYFTGSRLPLNVNGRKKITLGEMFDNKLLVEFKDQNNKACDSIGSFAEATKINNTDYTIKVKLVCGSESDYVIDTVSFEDNSSDIIDNDNINTDDNINNDNTGTNTSTNNTTNNTNKNPSTSGNKTNTSTTTKKPITNVTTKPSTNTSNSNKVINTCTYGSKDYTSTYPLAYVIPGNCAVSKSDYYKAEYSNKVSSITATEYKKLNNEIVALKSKTGANLYTENPDYFAVYNKANTGLVGYQILFTMKQKVNYTVKVVYQYYLDTNGNRKVVIDKRNSISSSNSSNSTTTSKPSTIKVTSVNLNKSTIEIDVNESYNLVATINPSNATNKRITWSSSNSSVVSVNSNGRVTALRSGNALITATVDGKSAYTRVYVNEGETYRYCSTSRERAYSTGYVNVNDLYNKSYTYQVALNVKNPNIYDLEYGNLTSGSDYSNAYRYWKDRYKPLTFVSGGHGNGNVDPGSYTNLINHSLKSYNFTPTVSYVKKSGNLLYFDINVRLKNTNYIENATPYNRTYFLPLYFDVVTINYNDCSNISSSEVNSYVRQGFVKVN